LAKDKEKVKSMSSEAQKLYEDVMKVEKDGSITFLENERKIHKIVAKVDKKVMNEFREKSVHLPTVPMKPLKKDDDSTEDTKDKTKSKAKRNHRAAAAKKSRAHRARFNNRHRPMHSRH
jgi:hypothetical protein